jgi:hypothetical protein
MDAAGEKRGEDGGEGDEEDISMYWRFSPMALWGQLSNVHIWPSRSIYLTRITLVSHDEFYCRRPSVHLSALCASRSLLLSALRACPPHTLPLWTPSIHVVSTSLTAIPTRHCVSAVASGLDMLHISVHLLSTPSRQAWRQYPHATKRQSLLSV